MKKLLAVLMIVALSVIGVATAAGKAGKAKQTSGVVYAGITHTEGKDLYVSGDFVDKKVFGHGGIVYVTRVTQDPDTGSFLVKAKRITIYTTKGSLTGKGQATQVIHEDHSVEVKDGTFTLDKGTGKYKGRTFKGTFSGDQNSAGLYTFNYKATYK